MTECMTKQTLESFYNHLRLQEKSQATIRKYLHDATQFQAFLQGRALDKEQAVLYKQQLLKKGYAHRSINSMIASLNCLFSFLKRQDCTLKSLRIQKEVYCPQEKELTKDDYARLVQAAKSKKSERLQLILQTICATGMRVSELCYVTVDAVKRGEAKVDCKGKQRTVFLVKDLQKKLLCYIKAQGLTAGCVFCTKTGKAVNRSNIWREMKALCHDAKVNPKKVFPHNLRHLFARTFYALEKDIAKLADILGHTSINTTRIYIITSATEHRSRMERMKLIL